MSKQNYLIAMLFVFLLALSVRIALTATFVGINSPPDADAQPDQVEYEALAWKPLAGQGYTWDGIPTARRMPGTSLTLMPVYALLGRSYAGARCWFCLLSALTCCAAAWLGTLLGDRRTGLLAGLFLALLPNHAYYSMHFVSEVPFALFITLATASTIVCMRSSGSTLAAVVPGLFWGLTALVRPNVLIAIGVLWVLAFTSRTERGLAIRKTVAITALCALSLAPWIIRNQVAIGSPIVSSVGSYTFWGAHNEITFETAPGSWIRTEDLIDANHPFSGTEVELNTLAWRYGFEFVTSRAASMPYLTGMKFYRLLSPLHDTPNQMLRLAFAAGWIVTGPLFLFGSIVLYRSDRQLHQLAWLGVWTTLATTFVFYGSIRFRDAIAPVYVAIGSVGVMVIVRWFRHRSSHASTELPGNAKTSR